MALSAAMTSSLPPIPNNAVSHDGAPIAAKPIPMPEMARDAANAPPMPPNENTLENEVLTAPVGLPETLLVPPPFAGTSYS